MTSESLKVRTSKCSQREPPPQDWLKCNFDCSYKEGNNYAGIGWIIINHQGIHICSGIVKVDNVNSPLQGEALAFLYVPQYVWVKGWRKVWFEGDNKELDRIVNEIVVNHVRLENILHDIRHWISLLPDCSLGSVNRERNMAADSLAKQSLIDPNIVVFYTIPPIWLVNFLYWPYTI